MCSAAWRFSKLARITKSWVASTSDAMRAGLAAWYAGLRGRALALSILGGVVVAAIVLLLQVFLQPGKALNDGVAAALQVTQ